MLFARAASVLLLVICACVPAPKKAYTPAEVDSITTLTELMRVQAHRADPLFALRDRTSFSDTQLDRLTQLAEIIEATAEKSASFAGDFDSGFAKLSNQLGRHATALGKAASARDVTAAAAALTSMHDTCKACHSSYR